MEAVVALLAMTASVVAEVLVVVALLAMTASVVAEVLVVVALLAMTASVVAEVLETETLERYGLGEVEPSNDEETSILVIILLVVMVLSKGLFKTTSSAISETIMTRASGITLVNNYF